MPAFKNPGFQERQKAAARARNAALTAYRAKPPVDEALVAERVARREVQEAAAAEKRAAMLRAKEETAETKREQERQAAVAAEVEVKARAAAAAQEKAVATPARLKSESFGPTLIGKRRATRAMPRERCAKCGGERRMVRVE